MNTFSHIKTQQAYIALGSNLPWQEYSSLAVIQLAIATLNKLSTIQVTQTSSIYQSPPLDKSEQPDYYNAVIEIQTALAPIDLLAVLKETENQFGRPKVYKKWSARTLDLDILLYGNLELESLELTVPHYDLKNRSFFINPLLEIKPHCQLPDGNILSPKVDPTLSIATCGKLNPKFDCF